MLQNVKEQYILALVFSVDAKKITKLYTVSFKRMLIKCKYYKLKLKMQSINSLQMVCIQIFPLSSLNT